MRPLPLVAILLVLTSIAVAQGVGTPSPTSLNFGSVLLNETSSAMTAELENTGNATMVVSSVSASAPFSVATNKCATLKAGKSCKVEVL
jgi:hypothetical protein